VCTGVVLLVEYFVDPVRLVGHAFSRGGGRVSGKAGTFGTLSRLPAGSGTVCDRLVGPITGCTIPGDVDDHEVGVVVVVDTLHGLTELEYRVDGLLTVLTDLLDA
jgi:hypothetical protein